MATNRIYVDGIYRFYVHVTAICYCTQAKLEPTIALYEKDKRTRGNITVFDHALTIFGLFCSMTSTFINYNVLLACDKFIKLLFIERNGASAS